MIVRIRDGAGKMRCSDYFRDDEDWQDAAEWLYNTYLTMPNQPPRQIAAVRVLPFAYHCDAYHVTMKYYLASNVTLFDDPVTVLKEASVHQPARRKTGAPASASVPPPAYDDAETQPVEIPTARSSVRRRTGA